MLDERQFFVYILANRKYETLYIGVTNNLLRRVHEHREGPLPGFARKYGVKHLVYYEACQDVGDAIYREKALKEWPRCLLVRGRQSREHRRHRRLWAPGFRRGDNRGVTVAGELGRKLAPMGSSPAMTPLGWIWRA